MKGNHSFRDARERKPWRDVVRRGWRRLRGGELTPRRAGLSLGLGVWIGCFPVFGVHAPVCLAVCLPLRLDGAVGLLGTQISNPLFAPGLIWLELQVGSLLLTGQLLQAHGAIDSGDLWRKWPVSLVVGALVVATVLAVSLGLSAAVLTRLRGAGRDA